jgi:hypothetical protein
MPQQVRAKLALLLFEFFDPSPNIAELIYRVPIVSVYAQKLTPQSSIAYLLF